MKYKLMAITPEKWGYINNPLMKPSNNICAQAISECENIINKCKQLVTGERAFTEKDRRWCSAHSGHSVDHPSYVYTLPSTLTLTLSQTTFVVGDKITITGAGITPESTLSIGSTSVTPSLISLDYLEFTVPSSINEGSYTLNYTNAAGVSQSFSITVSVSTSAPIKVEIGNITLAPNESTTVPIKILNCIIS